MWHRIRLVGAGDLGDLKDHSPKVLSGQFRAATGQGDQEDQKTKPTLHGGDSRAKAIYVPHGLNCNILLFSGEMLHYLTCNVYVMIVGNGHPSRKPTP